MSTEEPVKPADARDPHQGTELTQAMLPEETGHGDRPTPHSRNGIAQLDNEIRIRVCYVESRLPNGEPFT
jgi:hypothetical protein